MKKQVSNTNSNTLEMGLNVSNNILAPKNFWSLKQVAIKELVSMKKGDKLDTSTIYQRKAGVGLWKKTEHIDKFIMSVFKGWFLQPFQWRKIGENRYEVVDSLQRTTAITNLCSDTYIPKGLPEPFEHLNGVKFSEWPKLDQDNFLNKKILIVLIDTPNDTIIDYYVDVNKGLVPLTNAQAKRGKYSKHLIMLENIIKHDFWDQKPVSLDVTDRETVIMQIINSMKSDFPDHTSKIMVDWFVDWKYESKVKDLLGNKLNTFNSIIDLGMETEDIENYKIMQRFCKRIHIESILYVLTGKENKEQVKIIYDNLMKFFGTPKQNWPKDRHYYKDATFNDTSSHGSIITRHEIMQRVVDGLVNYLPTQDETKDDDELQIENIELETIGA